MKVNPIQRDEMDAMLQHVARRLRQTADDVDRRREQITKPDLRDLDDELVPMMNAARDTIHDVSTMVANLHLDHLLLNIRDAFTVPAS